VTRLRDAVEGVWEFIAGDDWVTAAGVVAALALTGLVRDDSSAWVVLPLAVGSLLALSIWREARRHRDD
jgi:hypothetical protein